MVPPIKQIVGTSTGEEGRKFIKTLGEYNENYIRWEDYKLLMVAKNSKPFVAMLLSRISHLDELHFKELQIH